MDTAQHSTGAPQPLGATLRRSTGDRVLLGLCAGIARATGTSPLAIRLATVLVSFLLLPFVLVAYVVTAVIVPRDDGAALVGTGWRDRRDVWVALVLTLIAAPAALSVGDDHHGIHDHGGFILVPLLALAALAYVAVRRDRRDGGPTPPTQPTTPTQPTVPTQPGTPTQPDATVAPESATAATAATAAFAAPPTGATSDAGTAADEPAAADAGFTPPAGAASDPSAPTFVRGPATPLPPAGPRRPGLTLPVLGAVAMVPAVFAILLAGGAVDADASSWGVMLAVMAVVSAAGAVTIAVLRPSYLGAGLLVLLAAALGIASIGVSQFGAVLDDGVGERAYRVSDPADLTAPFVFGAGEMNIDLRPLALDPRQRVTVHARLGFGEMNIAVPRGVRVTTTRPTGASGLTVTARENGASNQASADAPTIVLDLRGRGISAAVVTGRARDVSQLDVLARTDLGFWSGGTNDEPFTSTPALADPRVTSP